MKEPGFPPPDRKSQDTDFERKAQEEFYYLLLRGELPNGANGEPMTLSEFTDAAYAKRSVDQDMERTELEDGASVQVNTGYAESQKDSKRSRTRRRGTGRAGKAERAAADTEEEPAAEEPGDEEAFVALGAKLTAHRDAQDAAHAAILSLRNRIENPSPEMAEALEAYRTAERELSAHEEAHQAYARDAAGIAEAEKEIALIKKTLKAAETFISLGTAGGEADSGERTEPKDETPAEKRRQLRSKVEEMGTLSQAQERLFGKEDADGVQKQYFDELKAHNKKRNALSVAAADIVGEGALTPKQLKEMRKKWIASRAGLARAMRDSVDARFAATPSASREAMLERMREKYGTSERADIHARYERRYGRAAIILDAERAELAAREEGLSEREKGMLDKLYEGYKKLPPGVRILSTTALMFGAGAALAGTPVGWTALGMAGGGALMRWGAVARNSKLLGTVATGLSIGGLVGIGLDKLAGASHHVLGTKKQAEKTLAQQEGFGDLSNLKNLEKLANKRKSALVVEKNIERHRRWARVLGSIGAGWLLGHSGSAPQAEDGSSAEDAEATGASDAGAASQAEASETGASFSEAAAPAAGGEAPAAAAFVPEHVATIESGEGFNTLFRDLQESIRESGDAAGSPVAQRLLELSPTELSDSINAFDPESGGSMVMQSGDKLYIDGNDNLVFERGGETRILMEAENGVVQTHAFEDPTMLGPRAVPVPVQEMQAESSPAPETEMRAEEVAAPVPLQDAPPAPGAEFISAYSNPDAATAPGTASADAISSGAPSTAESGQPQFIRDYIAGEGMSEVITNGHGVEIAPDTAAAYELRMPGSDVPYIVVSGGTPEEASLVAQQYANEHPGTRVYFETPIPDPLTGQVQNRLDVWDSVASSSAERFNDIAPNPQVSGPSVPSMNTDDFTRRLTNIQ